MTERASGGRRGRAGLALGGALLLALLAAAGERAAARWAASGLPTGDAEWIWAPLPGEPKHPIAFWAVRDFTLDAVPEAASLLIAADEEYVVHLNGARVGSNRYAPGRPLDRYEVGPLLLPAGNRLAVELRSSRGQGGLLAALDLGEGREPVVSDRRWRVLRRDRPGVPEGWAPAGGGEPAASWGRPPVGRWGRPQRWADRPRAAEVCALCEPGAAGRRAGRAPEEVVFDFGREVAGYLVLERSADAAADGDTAAALLTAGERAPDPLAAPELAAPVLAMPGAREWTDPTPRRFRRVTVTGLEGLERARVLPVEDGALAALPGPVPGEGALRPVLGLEISRERSAVADEVRRTLRRHERKDRH